MLVRTYSNAYAITASADDVRVGTVGLYFSVAGTAAVTTMGGETINVIGAVGTIFPVPIKKVTALTTAVVLGLIAQ